MVHCSAVQNRRAKFLHQNNSVVAVFEYSTFEQMINEYGECYMASYNVIATA